jgi:hypothetical protein
MFVVQIAKGTPIARDRNDEWIETRNYFDKKSDYFEDAVECVLKESTQALPKYLITYKKVEVLNEEDEEEDTGYGYEEFERILYENYPLI